MTTRATPARWAFIGSCGLYVIAGVIAVLFVPWTAAVAPWADLAPEGLAAFTAEQVNLIETYVADATLPRLLMWLAPAVLSLIVLFVRPVRVSLARITPDKHPLISRFIVAAVLLAATRLVTLPFAILVAQARRKHGLLIEPWDVWISRWVLESVVFVLVGAVVVGLGLTVLQRWSRRGWIVIVAAALGVAIGVSAVVPFIYRLEGNAADPLLTSRVLDMADQVGVDVGSVQVIGTADRSPVINAYVSGWGPTRTVTFYDTVIATASPEEVDALIAHELVHVREGDIVLGTVLASLVVGGTAALVASMVLSTRVRRWLQARSSGDARLVPLVISVGMAAWLVGSVGSATISRALEARADREAVALTGNSEAYASLIVCLSVTNKSALDPPRWRYALFFTHPTPLQRLQAIDNLPELVSISPCADS